MLKVIWIILGSAWFLAIGAAVAAGLFSLGDSFGLITGAAASLLTLVNLLVFLSLEITGKKIIPWWPTPGWDSPPAKKILLFGLIVLMVAAGIYLASHVSVSKSHSSFDNRTIQLPNQNFELR